MFVKQISVFVENKRGRLKEMTEVLGTNGINLVTLQVADTKEFGILRAITKDNDRAVAVLRENGFTVSVTELIGVEVDDSAGALSHILEVFNDNNLSIEYLYSFARRDPNTAVILLRVDDTVKAVEVLEKNDIRTVTENIYQ